MVNPILSALNGTTTPAGPNNVLSFINSIRHAQNPQQMLNAAAKVNPQLRQIVDTAQHSNMSCKDLFYQAAQRQGVDPEQIINMLK